MGRLATIARGLAFCKALGSDPRAGGNVTEKLLGPGSPLSYLSIFGNGFQLMRSSHSKAPALTPVGRCRGYLSSRILKRAGRSSQWAFPPVQKEGTSENSKAGEQRPRFSGSLQPTVCRAANRLNHISRETAQATAGSHLRAGPLVPPAHGPGRSRFHSKGF